MSMIHYGGNRGFGINRQTYNTVSGISRAARPYLQRGYKAVGNYVNGLRSRMAARSATQSSIRSAKSTARRNLFPRTAPVGTQITSGGGETKSFSTFKNPKIKMTKMEEQLVSNHVVRNFGTAFSCSQAVQATGMLGRFFDTNDIFASFADVNQPTATPGYNSGKLALLNIHSTIMITNASSLNVHATIYEVMSRQDGSDINPDPLTVFLAGGVDATGGAAVDALVPGYSPYSNPRFVSSYKILKKTPLIWQSGQTHVHRIKYALNKIVSRERLITSDSAGPLGGITIYSFIIFHGTPDHAAADETLVSTSASKLDVVAFEELEFKCMLLNSAYNSVTNSLTVLTNPEQWATDNPLDTAAAT